jgi:hypothetical protein
MKKLFLDYYPMAVMMSTVEQYSSILDELGFRYGALRRRAESLRGARGAESLALTKHYEELCGTADSLGELFGVQMAMVMGCVFLGAITNMFRLYNKFITSTASQVALKILVRKLPNFFVSLWILFRPILASLRTVSQVSSSNTKLVLGIILEKHLLYFLYSRLCVKTKNFTEYILKTL